MHLKQGTAPHYRLLSSHKSPQDELVNGILIESQMITNWTVSTAAAALHLLWVKLVLRSPVIWAGRVLLSADGLKPAHWQLLLMRSPAAAAAPPQNYLNVSLIVSVDTFNSKHEKGLLLNLNYNTMYLSYDTADALYCQYYIKCVDSCTCAIRIGRLL